jgi:hypothetical protein
MWKQVLVCFLLLDLARNAALWYITHQADGKVSLRGATSIQSFPGEFPVPVQLHVWQHQTAGVISKHYTEYLLEIRSRFCFDASARTLSLQLSSRRRVGLRELAAERRVRSFLQQLGFRIEIVEKDNLIDARTAAVQNETLVLTWLSRAAYFNPAHFAGEWLSTWALLRERVSTSSARRSPLVLWWPVNAAYDSSPLAACETDRDHCSIFCVLLRTVLAEYSALQAVPSPLRRDTQRCGTALLIPGLLKSRFFRSLEDAVAWREAMLKYLGIQESIQPCCAGEQDRPRCQPFPVAATGPSWQQPQPKLRVTYLRRGPQKRSAMACQRRCLANEDQMLALLRRYRGIFHYDLNVVEASANDTTWASVRRIVEIIQQSNVLISLHGAQLVYAPLLPPWQAALIELFPYGFQHDMYAHGGGAPLHYFSIEGDPLSVDGMQGGVREEGEFSHLTRSRASIEKNGERERVHQRDQAVWVPLRPLRNALEVALATVRSESCGLI